MESEAAPRHRRDAFWAAGITAALGCLWIFFGFYWQGALLLGGAAILAWIGRRQEDAAPSEPSQPPKEEKAPITDAKKSKGRKRRR
ncbi:MAG: hypothetical protein RBU30_02235 [Polyangia bacterium]|jgi:membrane protein implicated in regulation of membrane protease activity|nr:hypothetical protein [Polyangia bacterium]